MTIYSRGDVVLVPIEFTDKSGSKPRPAVIVSSDEYNQSSPDLLIASLTGNLNAVHHTGDRPLEHWQEAGLYKPSLLQMKIATIEPCLIQLQLGSLTQNDLVALDRALKEALCL